MCTAHAPAEVEFVWGGVGWGGGGGGFHSIMWSPQLRFVLELGCDNIVEHEDIMNHVLLVGHANLVSHISPDSLLDSTEKRMKLWKFCSRDDRFKPGFICHSKPISSTLNKPRLICYRVRKVKITIF